MVQMSSFSIRKPSTRDLQSPNPVWAVPTITSFEKASFVVSRYATVSFLWVCVFVPFFVVAGVCVRAQNGHLTMG